MIVSLRLNVKCKETILARSLRILADADLCTSADTAELSSDWRFYKMMINIAKDMHRQTHALWPGFAEKIKVLDIW